MYNIVCQFRCFIFLEEQHRNDLPRGHRDLLSHWPFLVEIIFLSLASYYIHAFKCQRCGDYSKEQINAESVAQRPSRLHYSFEQQKFFPSWRLPSDDAMGTIPRSRPDFDPDFHQKLVAKYYDLLRLWCYYMACYFAISGGIRWWIRISVLFGPTNWRQCGTSSPRMPSHCHPKKRSCFQSVGWRPSDVHEFHSLDIWK
jgi:hypothetical protein